MQRILLAIALAIALTGGTSSNALAAAGPSCVGLGSSGAPKPGTTVGGGPTGEGGRATIAHFVKENFALFGSSTPGGVYSSFAKVHASNVAGCGFEG